METNLAYAGGGDNQFGDVMPAITQGVSGVNIGAGQVCRGDTTTLNTFRQGCYWIPTSANPTFYPTQPSTATDGGLNVIATRQFGYHYNWCAAMGNQSAACQATTATPTDPAINICPLGWRLPTGGAVSEFAQLNNTINGGSNNSVTGLFTNGLLMGSGTFQNGGWDMTAYEGYYWSSTVSTASTANIFVFSPGSISTTTSNNKSEGKTIRCVAP